MPQAWRTVRIFISSTFRDMQAERDHLVRFVFPELRERCATRHLHLIDVDLRWGVTETDAKEGKALDICLEEIQRCRPFFVGLLGERYGWVPPEYVVPDEPRFEWLKEFEPGYSITALEIHEGVLRNPQAGGRAFFYFRDPKFIDGLPEDERQYFLPASEEDKQKLLRLKQKIRSQCAVKEYAALNQDFEQKVLDDLWSAIQAEYPQQEEHSHDDLATEREHQQAFIEDRTQDFVGRTDLLSALKSYADGSTATPLLVVGLSGSGKSALLAKFAQEYTTEHQDLAVIPHFVGVSPNSVDVRLTLRRLCREVAAHVGVADEVPDDYEKLRLLLPQLLDQAGRKGRLLIIVDALNQFETTHSGIDAGWLPTRLSDSVKVIVSSLEGEWTTELRRRGSEMHELTVGALAASDRKQIVRRTLGEYRKCLSEPPDKDQMGALLGKQEADKPLYLAIACEELRVFGEFDQVLRKITDFAEDVPGLFEQVLTRLERDHGEWLIRDSLSLLACSRRGLLESELLELLKREDEAQLLRAIWAPAYRSLRFYLRSPGENHEGELGFFHQQLQQAVEKRYLSSAESRLERHRKLAAFFRRKGDPQENSEWDGNYPRALAELPYQLAGGDEDGEYEKLLSTPSFLQAKVGAFGSQPLIEDYDLPRHKREASGGSRGISEPLKLIQGALRLSANAIDRDTHEFAPQMVGRLLPHHENPAIERFTAKVVDGTHTPWLRPLQPTLHPPGTGLLRTLTGHSGSVKAVAVTPDGRLALSASMDQTLKVWELGSGRELRTLTGHAGGVRAVAVTPDGQRAVSASDDKTLKVWDLASGRELRTLTGHSERVSAVAVTPDGQRAVSASEDQTLKVWELGSGRELRTLTGHTELGQCGGGDAGRAARGLGVRGQDAEGVGSGAAGASCAPSPATRHESARWR